MSFVSGLLGVVVGAFLQFSLDRLARWLDDKNRRELDNKRISLLKQALENPPSGNDWRNLSTLSRIIGADYATTTRLLIELGARGSESEEDVWALLERKPLR